MASSIQKNSFTQGVPEPYIIAPPSGNKTHLKITIEKKTTIIGSCIGTLLFCGPQGIATGTGLALLASTADKRAPFNLPVVLGSSAAVQASYSLFGALPTFTFLFGTTLALANRILQTPSSETSENLTQLRNSISKTCNATIGAFSSVFEPCKRDLELNWDGLKAGFAEAALQAKMAIQAGASSVADAANSIYNEGCAAIDRIKTNINQLMEEEPVETNNLYIQIDDLFDSLEDVYDVIAPNQPFYH